MIHVDLQPEPSEFGRLVRVPGKSFLSSNHSPSSKDLQANNYWKHAKKDLCEVYKKICAYTCGYLPGMSGTVDHFLPKARYPEKAYEWDNFRLAGRIVNGFKGDEEDLCDPFEVESGWFVIVFPGCLVKPGDNLPETNKRKVNRTIKVLRLNDYDSFVQERVNIMLAFASGKLTLDYLSKKYPFLANEIKRQEIEKRAVEIFKYRRT